MTFICNSSVPNANVLGFLSGGGEMGERIRTFDWSTTSLGCINSWPQSLLTSLSIVLHSKFPMFIWWGDDLIQFYNDAYRPSMGKDSKHPKALGQKGAECWQEIWHVIKPLIDRVYHNGESTWSENQLIPIFRNGKMEDVYWTFSYSPIYIECGKIGGVMVVCTETTNAVVNLRKVEESENKLRFAIDAAELATWDYDPQKDIFEGNERLKEWFGFSSLAKIDLAEVLHVIADNDRERVVKAIEMVLNHSSGGIYNINYTIIHPVTKEERIVHAKGKAWFNDKKEAYRFNGTLQDITAEYIAREMNDEIRDQIRLAGDRLKLALQAGEIGYYEWIIESDEMNCNSLYKKIFGFSEEHQPSYKELNTKIIPQDLHIRNAVIQKAMQGGGEYNAEYRIHHSNGEIRWVKSFGKAIFDEANKPVKLIGMILDITEHIQFAEELSKQVQERTAELKQTNADLLQFAHVASHDLKEPVRKIKIFSNRIKEELSHLFPEKGHIYLDKILHSTDRMISMIEGVLTYSTLSDLSQAIEKIDLNNVIINIKKDLEILIEEKNATIITDKLPVIEGVPVLIYQLFYNLMNNALKFSKYNVAAHIQIAHVQEKISGTLYEKITIADNGIGFSKDNVDHIFDAFIRLNSKDKYEGTGLGLALCKKIAERHNGKIFASGVKDHGAVFTILLPLSSIKQ